MTANNIRGWIQDLPKVPVPDLEKTLERYLACLKPVIPVSQYEQTKKTVDLFLKPDGEGERLQELLHLFSDQRENWVTELWLDDMYLNNPLPLPINSNPFYLLPKQQFRSTSDQLRFASRIIQFAHLYKIKIDSQTLPQDFASGHGKGLPLCMETYSQFFCSTRVPGERKDELLVSKEEQRGHIVVASRNQFFLLNLDKEELPQEDAILDGLRSICYMSKECESSCVPIGLLTTENRKVWGALRNNMIKNPVNRQSLHYLDTSLYVVCLDESVSVKAATARNQRRDSIQMARMEAPYMASQLIHGGGTEYYTANRWFDKFLQFVVGKDGVCGIVCEHSPSEGIAVLRFCEEFLEYLKKNPINENSVQRKDSVKGMGLSKNVSNLLSNKTIVRLQWDLDEASQRGLQEASKRINKLVEDLDVYVLNFNEFGKQFVKEQQISPDAFVQLALQLTYYKVHRKLVSTYESASIRQFRLGRVDNIRAATFEALAWAKAMCDEIPEITEQHKVNLFKKAIDKQIEVLRYTIAGHGTDNHLLGLREMAKQNGEELPLLFREKAYKEYLNFRLSTSQLPTDKAILVGYGAVVPDGYGCSYNPCPENIVFCISSFYSSPETSSDFFALSLEGSLLQMRELCLKLGAGVQVQADHEK